MKLACAILLCREDLRRAQPQTVGDGPMHMNVHVERQAHGFLASPWNRCCRGEAFACARKTSAISYRRAMSASRSA